MAGVGQVGNYVFVKDLGQGNFGLAKLMQHIGTGELVAIKFIERGEKIDRNVEREILNHRMLNHPTIVCFKEGVCHRDLKLENTLLDGNPAPRIKICDFGYSKSVFDSQPKSTVGTPAYIAPEVLQCKEYDGQMADHPWFLINLPIDLADPFNYERNQEPVQSIEEIKGLIQLARNPAYGTEVRNSAGRELSRNDYMDSSGSGSDAGNKGPNHNFMMRS
eukprot:gene25921-11597_t